MDTEKFDHLLDRLSRVEHTDTKNLRHIIETKMAARRRRGRLSRVLKSCAAVILPLLLAGGIWFYSSGNGPGSQMDKVAVAADNVRLMLSDGTEIILDDSNENGRLHQQDNFVLSRENGSIIAESSGGGPHTVPEPVYGCIVIPKGAFFDMTLADGTRVWLNSESQLRFPLEFTGEERRVYLSGEGYFEVKKDLARRFVVEAGGNEIVVLGTAFNIAAYGETGNVAATLVNGSVEVISGDASVILAPGEQAIITSNDDRITVNHVNASLYSSWRIGVFDFEEMKLKDICERLTRWYDVEFVFEGDTGNERFSGGAWMNEPLGNFLSNVELATDVVFSEQKGRIIVSERK